MPSKGYSAVPNLKVKRLTRLFESKMLSPRKAAMMAKEQRNTKSSKGASAGTGKNQPKEKEQPGKSKVAGGAGEGTGAVAPENVEQ